MFQKFQLQFSRFSGTFDDDGRKFFILFSFTFRITGHLLQRTGRKDLPLFDDDGAVADILQFRKDVAAQKDGFFLSGKDFEQIAQFQTGSGVQPCRRFIHDQHLGIVDQRPCQTDTLFHAFGKGTQRFIPHDAQIGEFLHVFQPCQPFFPFQSVAPGDEVQIFPHHDVAEVRQGVRHIAHDLPHLFGVEEC